MKKFNVEKFTIEFYILLEFAPPAVRRLAARGPKRKTFPPKFLDPALIRKGRRSRRGAHITIEVE